MTTTIKNFFKTIRCKIFGHRPVNVVLAGPLYGVGCRYDTFSKCRICRADIMQSGTTWVEYTKIGQSNDGN